MNQVVRKRQLSFEAKFHRKTDRFVPQILKAMLKFK